MLGSDKYPNQIGILNLLMGRPTFGITGGRLNSLLDPAIHLACLFPNYKPESITFQHALDNHYQY